MSVMEQPGTTSRIVPVRSLDVAAIRRDFPILQSRVHSHPLVYLDNAATSQKPRQVIEALSRYYTSQNANIHRGVHYLSETATAEHEEARERLRRFINAAQAREIVFVRGATEAINLVAQTWGRTHVKSGDEILVTHLEHHANIVPWQILCEQTGARLRVAPINDAGELLMDEFEQLLNPRTRLVSVTCVSNALGTINPLSDIIALAHARGIPVLLDGAQSVPHMHTDVQELGCDFFVFSGHKMFGPTGIGVLYGKAARLEAMPPYQGGGDMIRSVSFDKTIYNDIPFKFEAGTPDIGGAIALGVAAEYLQNVGMDLIADYEYDLLDYATRALCAMDRIRIVGTAARKASVVSFVIEGVHPHDIGTILDQEGIAIRTGHHCAQPVIERLGVDATARASLAFYNTRQEIDALVAGLRRVVEVFG